MIDNIKENIRDIISDEACSIQLYLLLKRKGQYELKLADIEEVSTPLLQQLFVSNLDYTIVNNNELSIRSLSKDDESSMALYLYDYEDYPEELSIFKEFKINEAINSEKFNFNEDSLSDLFGFIIYIGTMGKGVALFKKIFVGKRQSLSRLPASPFPWDNNTNKLKFCRMFSCFGKTSNWRCFLWRRIR